MKTFRKHLIYWILPSLFVGVSIWIYFFDILGMSYILSPEYNREFGIIENTQLAIIFAIILISCKKLRKARLKPTKLILIILIIGSTFVFLEEIDYGLHYYDYLSGKTMGQLKSESWSGDSIRNIHNQGDITKFIKLFIYLFIILLLAITPLLSKKFKINKNMAYFTPKKHYFVYTLLAMAFLNQIVLYIDKSVKDSAITSLDSNVSEFEEIFIYYIVFLYILEKTNLLLELEELKIKKRQSH